ncbi:hypothetical protein G8J22_01439 [Lentilactobacillus hilgardii]|nr:hypothetical protein G8J22_01439 [Lentilactobacillus hilgardii]TDG80828.1 hypothetical protein C5L34_001536 [Lentilactobacillus hilgardii]
MAGPLFVWLGHKSKKTLFFKKPRKITLQKR